MNISTEVRNQAQDLLDYIDASPSPWHAVDSAECQLLQHGFNKLTESDAWELKSGQSYFVVRGGASIIAFRIGSGDIEETGFRIIGAHTDSPGLRLKPHAAFESDGLTRIGVEVYGGPILATFTDRDLSVAGRVTLRNQEAGFKTHLIKFDHSVMRLPNLAIHMNREVNDKGLKLNKQTELPLIFGESESGVKAEIQFLSQIASKLNVEQEDILSLS